MRNKNKDKDRVQRFSEFVAFSFLGIILLVLASAGIGASWFFLSKAFGL